ncbi:hypothetical protein EDD15DRAFT_2105686, partial [Pisolithus albus]
TVLYDEDAPPEKKERVIRTAASTTSFSTGMRLTGFQVYANAHPLPKLTSKKNTVRRSYQNISHGMSSFFSLSGFPPLACLHPSCINGIPGSRWPSARHLPQLKVRTVGGSILTIYEGNCAGAEKAAPSEDSFEDDDGDEDESRLFRLSLIDFAHTRLVLGQGPDTRVLL